jgi:Ca-activated chloride channel family protein
MQLRRRSLLPPGQFVAAAVVCMAVAWPAGAQKPPTPETAAFRADSALVLVPVTVVDRRGAMVSGLDSDAFTVTEDGVRQRIRSFAREDAPVSMGIVLDLSGSMKGVLGAAKESLGALMKDANTADEVFLNAVSTRPRAYAGFTHEFDEILRKVAFEEAAGDTALIDTIYESLKELRSGVHSRKALLVISDGMDNHSRYSKRELLELAQESDAQIYTIAAFNAPPYSKPIAVMEERKGLLFLDELAARTGGMSFIVHGATDIAAAAASIGQVLRNQYTIGYEPQGNDRSGQWRRIKVKVAKSGLRAYARAGYRLD